ncbi:MAG: hypothetical protein PVI43_05185, partial [Candidatus Bathyarchaeota archaeon]
QWSKVFLNNQTIDFGQLFYWDGFNMHGCFAYLWVSSGSGYQVFDAYSGDWVFTVTNVPSGTMLFDELNRLYVLSVSQNAGRMTLWNMTALGLTGGGFYGEGSWGNTVHGKTFDGSNSAAITMNVTIPTGLPGSVIAANFGDMVVGGDVSTEEVSLWGINLNTSADALGAELFTNTWEAFPYWEEMNLTVAGMFGDNWVGVSFEDRVAVLWGKETRQHFGFSLETGDFLWGPDNPDTGNQYYLDALDDSSSNSRAIAYGRFYSASVGGIVYCYDIQNGTLLWETPIDDPYSEFLFANTWWVKPSFVTDGKIYMGHCEHSPVDPRPRGGPYVCLDAITGDVVWRADGLFRQTRWGGRAIIGDSIIATMDTYDQRVYAIGKGQSLTTLTVAPKIVAKGETILLEGTVMDASPGTEQADVKLRFPNGVPAVSDASMSDWMLYIYKQFEVPANVTGVEVVFNWVDADGHWHDMDRTTTDMSGTYSFAWTPDTEGTVKIVATFFGSGGYFGSYAETALVVGPAPAGYLGPSASEIAQETVSQMPDYPVPPTASEIAQTTVDMIPEVQVPSAADVAQETVNQLPAYLTLDLIVIILAVIGIVLGLYAILIKKK